MKTGYLSFCLTLLLAWHVPVQAEDSPNDQALPPVQLRFTEGLTCPVSPMHVYGGQALRFKLAVEAPLRTRVRILADLFQLTSGGMAAPLQRDVAITSAILFEDRTYVQAACLLPSLPAVQRKTTMLLKLKAADSANGFISWNLTLVVYPAAEPEAWRKTIATRLTQSRLQRLAVFGEGTALRQFLRSRKVAFDDLGEDWPGELDTQTLYLGETRISPPPRVGDLAGVRIVLFLPRADEQLPAGVYQSSDAKGGNILKVTLPTLLIAPGDNPAAEAALDEIFRRALEPRATSETMPESVFTP